MSKSRSHLEDNPLWYKDAVIYQLHVKSFMDSNGDGVGDFAGLTRKLDYLEDLGVNVIWLLPFYPSPLKDDGYDISDYYSVNPDYGTLADFRKFLKEARARNIRVITELVINHTSDRHEWFQRARRARPGTEERGFYVWSDTDKKYGDARIIFKDFEKSNWTWDSKAKAYYWHRFYSHQPDLNFESAAVQKELFRVLDFWFKLGVDGMRLDAVPYLYEKEGTNCENLPETHAFLKRLRAHVDRKYKNRVFLAEANQWPEDAADYFGKGDECHMAFHFPLMPRLFMALRMEDKFPVIDILQNTPSIPEKCQWAMFLRNHDELTLEMVTDEERDYMYQSYAKDERTRINLGIRRRLAPLLNSERRRIELMNVLLFSLPGTPVIYYGDEIGMGDNCELGDRDGVRTPMQWDHGKNAGFSEARAGKLPLPVINSPEFNYEAVNVEVQEKNLSSLLWWTKRAVAMRKKFKAFGRGSIEFPYCDNPKVLAFLRRYGDETILVVVNLSRFTQLAKIDLSKFAGFLPEEVYSGNKFPAVRKAPYTFTLGFHDYHWFSLKKPSLVTEAKTEKEVPELTFRTNWKSALKSAEREQIERVLPAYLKSCRWFGGKARSLRRLKITDTVVVRFKNTLSHLAIVETFYSEGASEKYLLPLCFGAGEKMLEITKESPRALIAYATVKGEAGILYDGVYDEDFRKVLLENIARRKQIKTGECTLTAAPGSQFRKITRKGGMPKVSQVSKAEQSNTSIFYGDKFYLKLYRRVQEGVNPDLEIEKFLTEKASFPFVPPFAGEMQLKDSVLRPVTVGLLQGFIPNQKDAWSYTLDAVGRFQEHVLAKGEEDLKIAGARKSLSRIKMEEIPQEIKDLIGGIFLENVALLGVRTGEMHLALSSAADDPDFTPEPFSKLYQRSVYQAMGALTRRVFQLLRANIKSLPGELRAEAKDLAKTEERILARFGKVAEKKFEAMKIRIHGDYHLGQVLFTGKDFLIIDFEGEPLRPLSERRLKRSPLRDVAGLVRSFHYAVYHSLLLRRLTRPEDLGILERWADVWYSYVSGLFLDSYFETVKGAEFIPSNKTEIETLLNAFLLEKAVYELGYELDNRPAWIVIPSRGIAKILPR